MCLNDLRTGADIHLISPSETHRYPENGQSYQEAVCTCLHRQFLEGTKYQLCYWQRGTSHHFYFHNYLWWKRRHPLASWLVSYFCEMLPVHPQALRPRQALSPYLCTSGIRTHFTFPLVCVWVPALSLIQKKTFLFWIRIMVPITLAV